MFTRLLTRLLTRLFTPMQKQDVIIHIGQYHVSRRPAVIYTLLGSCVAVCLYDPRARIGGMNHILLPGRAELSDHGDATRFGVNAMELLINGIMKRGGDRLNLKAKLFGGAEILPGRFDLFNIGKQNAEFAVRFLATENIEIVSRDLGGDASRKVFFHTDTGEVFLKRLKTGAILQLAREEERRSRRIR